MERLFVAQSFDEVKMSTLVIEKFINGQSNSTINIPFFVVRTAKKLMPTSMLSALADKGIDLSAIIQANKSHMHYSSTLRVKEHGIEKVIVVSLQ